MCVFQHVDEQNAYMCGYLKIQNLTDEYPEMVTFFDGEIIRKSIKCVKKVFQKKFLKSYCLEMWNYDLEVQ